MFFIDRPISYTVNAVNLSILINEGGRTDKAEMMLLLAAERLLTFFVVVLVKNTTCCYYASEFWLQF